MGYVTDVKEEDLIFVGIDDLEVSKIASMVEKLNADLVDSGFEQYRFDVEVKGDKTYIKRV